MAGGDGFTTGIIHVLIHLEITDHTIAYPYPHLISAVVCMKPTAVAQNTLRVNWQFAWLSSAMSEKRASSPNKVASAVVDHGDTRAYKHAPTSTISELSTLVPHSHFSAHSVPHVNHATGNMHKSAGEATSFQTGFQTMISHVTSLIDLIRALYSLLFGYIHKVLGFMMLYTIWRYLGCVHPNGCGLFSSGVPFSWPIFPSCLT